MEDYRTTEFGTAVANGIYLNHAGVSPTPARVVRAVQDAVGRMSVDPMAFFMQTAMPAIASARGRLARLMGVPSEHIALMKNTGQGLALMADGLILEPGDNVVSAECEYPSVVYPWYAQSWRGIETRLVQTRPDGTISLEDVESLVDDRTRVITLSWVQFGTGYRADLQAWTDFAHAHGAIFVVDVIQGLGVLPLSAAEIGIDVVASGVHKWLLAPPGTGGIYIAPHVLERMRLLNMGALSVVDVPKFDPLVFTPKPTAMRYEEGSPNVLGFIGLDAALSLLEEVGISEVGTRVLALSGYAAEALEKKGYKVETPRPDSERAGIVMFSHDTHENEAVLETLEQNGVTAAIRGGLLRFSPHFYNNTEDIDLAVAALPT